MNIIDIIILAILAFAIYQGVRDGLIIQGLAIVGIAVGLWIGNIFGDKCASLIGIKGDYSSLWGFLIVVFLTIIGVAIVARMVRKLLHFAGLGNVDVILGAILSVCKFLLILSILFAAFDHINNIYSLVEDKTINNSLLYRPIANITTWAAPAWDWAQDYIDI